MLHAVYNVIGKYGNREAELIDSFDTKEEAELMAAEYRLAFGRGWFIYTTSEAHQED